MTESESRFPVRTVHIDFHTSPHIRDVACDFKADEFAAIFAKANADSVCVFAKCHHGMLYYNTIRPERHPGLPAGLDLLSEQVEALHKQRILAPIYLSVQCDEYAAENHPDWVAVDSDDKQVKWAAPFEAGWRIMDMSSPYQDYLADQLDEVLKKFAPADGIIFDMCWDQPSISKYACDGMKKRGYDPQNENDRNKYAREVACGYMERYRKMVDDAHRGHPEPMVWFNSRPKMNLNIEKKYINHILIECLPTGGAGYSMFPYVVRYVRPFGLPTISHSSRFNKAWGDFGGLKPEAAMRYECCLMMSQGIGLGMGDQLHPRGTLDKPVYDMLGRIYGYVKECEPWYRGGKLKSEVGVLIDPKLGDSPGPAGIGITRLMQELRCQYDLLPPESDFTQYRLVIVSEMVKVDACLRDKLREFAKNGGALLFTGSAALDESGQPVMEELGISAHGDSPYSISYLKPDQTMTKDLSDMVHVVYERAFRMKARDGAQTLCEVIDPYFERTYEHFCSHGQTPCDKSSGYSAVVKKGNIITFAFPIFTDYGKNASFPHRLILKNCIGRIMPEPLVRDNGPTHLETTVVEKDGKTVVHLISYYPLRKTETMDIIDNPFPLVNLRLSIRLYKAPNHAILAPSGKEIPFEYKDGRSEVIVDCLDGHVMVVFDAV